MSDNMLYLHVLGCLWALMAGLVTGVTRLILVFVFPAPESCGQLDNRPDVIRKLHYMYFAILLFWVNVISGIIVTYLTPPPTPQQVWWFDCLGLTSLLNTRSHFTTVPACCRGTLTNVLPHRNAMPQTQDMTPHPVTVYRHRTDLSLSYPLMWNVTLVYTTTHFIFRTTCKSVNKRLHMGISSASRRG